jgi:hypothetical protein
MTRWNRHEKLLLVEIIIALIIPLGSLLIATTDLPEVALVMQSTTHEHKDLYFTEARFTNISYSAPIIDFHAEWAIACDSVSVDSEGMVPDVQVACEPGASRATLAVANELSARAWVAADFRSAVKPVHLPIPHVIAFQPRVFVTGVAKFPVVLLSQDVYDQLEARYYHRLVIFLLAGIGTTIAILIMLRYALKEDENDPKRSAN